MVAPVLQRPRRFRRHFQLTLGSGDGPPAAVALASGTGNSAASLHLKEALLRHNRSTCSQEFWAYALGA